jgi:hypothetical protein
MSQQPRTRHTAFAVAAGAVAITAILIVPGATPDGRDRGSTRGVPSRHVPRPVGPATARPAPSRPGLTVASVRATRIARRFGAAWRAWDTGRRAAHDAATLRLLSEAGLWRRLRHQRAGPTASGPPSSPALNPVRATASGRGTWRAALVARDPADGYLGTLVIVTTPAGPRVARIER